MCTELQVAGYDHARIDLVEAIYITNYLGNI